MKTHPPLLLLLSSSPICKILEYHLRSSLLSFSFERYLALCSPSHHRTFLFLPKTQPFAKTWQKNLITTKDNFFTWCVSASVVLTQTLGAEQRKQFMLSSHFNQYLSNISEKKKKQIVLLSFDLTSLSGRA